MATFTDIRDIQKSIELSFEVEQFLNGPIGKYVIARAEAQIEKATEELKRIDPDDTKAVRALQHRIHVAEDFQYWFAEAIQSGFNAAEEIQQEL